MADGDDGQPGRLVNTIQAAALAGVCRRTIYYWITAGKVVAVQRHGSTLVAQESLPRKKQRAMESTAV